MLNDMLFTVLRNASDLSVIVAYLMTVQSSQWPPIPLTYDTFMLDRFLNTLSLENELVRILHEIHEKCS